jgi:hypothetical protein
MKEARQTKGEALLKSDASPKKSLRQVLKRDCRGRHYNQRKQQLHACYCPEDLPVGQDVEVEDSEIDPYLV